MGSIRVQATLICTALSLVAAASDCWADDPFYKGKRLTVLVNYAAGGPTDIEGRLFAKHIARHIEGAPLLVVQNRDGASGVVGTNYLGEVAPRDGSIVGYLTGAAWQYVADPTRHKADLKTYEFVGFQPGTTIYYARADTPPGIRKPADFMRVTQLIVGGLGIDSPKDLLNRLELDLLGVKFKYVTGYSSSQTARLALLRNEINMYSESVPTYKTSVAPLVQKGEVFALWYDPAWDGKTLGVPKQVEGLPIPAFQDYFRDQKGGAMPSGILWDVTRTILSVNTAMQRLVAMPPGVPAPAVRALRAALRELNTDREFAAEAEKVLGFVPEYFAERDTNERVRNALNAPDSVRTFVAQYIKDAYKNNN
jgi:tripartite-type tricarboxylate transporter receptor subunit TctC